MASNNLHKAIIQKSLPELRSALDSASSTNPPWMKEYDEVGSTPLMLAVKDPEMDPEVVRLLLDHGADVKPKAQKEGDSPPNVMRLALGVGNPEIIKLLLQAGADLHYRAKHGYNALVDAVHHRDVFGDSRLLSLLDLLITSGVELNGITSYGESGLRVLSRLGRFDAIQVLLDHGADASQLAWTPLMTAIALGSLQDVQQALERGALLEEKDWWKRTPWLLSIQTGDLSKARLLHGWGADTNARGQCGKPPLFYAIAIRSQPMLRWLLEIGTSVGETDDFGQTALVEAVESNIQETVETLLGAGADVNQDLNDQTALTFIQSREIGLQLLRADADPRHLLYEGHRLLLGLNSGSSRASLAITLDEFRELRFRRFGTTNPERIHNRFWEETIRTGISAFEAAGQFENHIEESESPVWSAERFGQSITFLADGRIFQIGGEHEDGYHPDFCIYNDVFVHLPDGEIQIFGYPETDFPPTDSHTATLVENRFIWIIGSLGYSRARKCGHTPVHRLDTATMRIDSIESSGENPGWIHRHRAKLLPNRAIQISGGTVVSLFGERQVPAKNEKTFVLDTENCVWHQS